MIGAWRVGQLLAWARDETVVGDVSVTGGVVSYNAFTGSHYAMIDVPMTRGELASLTGDVRLADDDAEPVYLATRTKVVNDPASFGSYLAPINGEDGPAPGCHQIMSVGNGEMWVIDTGRDVEPGDLLISSDVAGCAMLDDAARFATGHIVGRAAQRVRWRDVAHTSDAGSQDTAPRRVKISVLFDRFTRHSLSLDETDERMIQKRSERDAEIAELREQVESLRAMLQQVLERQRD